MSQDALRLVKVVKGGARSGERCLEITDDGKCRQAFDPHFYLTLQATNGVKRIRFSLRNDDAAKVLVELRDYAEGNNYATGPEVSFYNGKLQAHGRHRTPEGRIAPISEALAQVAPGTWVDVEIELALSGENAGTWVCAAAVAGGERRVSRRLMVLRDAFRELDWVGFITSGPEKCTWRLDDFDVE